MSLPSYQIWYSKPENKEKRKAQMRAYYHRNKEKWVERKKHTPKRKYKNKGQREFRERRAKCVHYLKYERRWSYRKIALRLSISDPKNVWRILKSYERNKHEKEA